MPDDDTAALIAELRGFAKAHWEADKSDTVCFTAADLLARQAERIRDLEATADDWQQADVDHMYERDQALTERDAARTEAAAAEAVIEAIMKALNSDRLTWPAVGRIAREAHATVPSAALDAVKRDIWLEGVSYAASRDACVSVEKLAPANPYTRREAEK